MHDDAGRWRSSGSRRDPWACPVRVGVEHRGMRPPPPARRTTRPSRGARSSASATCARRSAASSSPSSRRTAPGHRRPRQPRRPALARAHLPQGRGPRRRLRGPRPAAAPGHAGRRRRRRDVGGDRLGRGARPGRRRPRARDQRARPRRARRSTSATPTSTRSARRPTASALVKAFRTRNKFSATRSTRSPTSSWPG